MRKIAERCAHQVDDDDREAGRDIYLYRCVEILRVDVDRMAARVEVGELTYQVQLAWDSRVPFCSELRASCECASQRLCSHVWSAILLYDHRGGRIPGNDDLDVVFPEEPLPWPEPDRFPSISSGIRGHYWYSDPPFEEKEEEKPSWRQHLDELAPSLEPEPWRREVLYHLDMWDTPESQKLMVHLYQRALVKSGGLGSVKKLKISEHDAARMPDRADREILSLLIATASTQDVRRRYRPWRSKNPRRYGSGVIPSIAYSTALPLLCSTGRFSWVRAFGEEEVPLSWDERPWSFVLSVERHRRLGKGRVSGVLRRGEETRLLEEAQLVLIDGLVMFDETLSPLEVSEGAAWILRLKKQGDILLPASELAELTERLWDLPTLPSLELPADLELERVHVAPGFRMTLRPESERSGNFLAEVWFDYDSQQVSAKTQASAITDRKRRRILLRDPEAEQEASRQLAELGVRPVVGSEHAYRIASREFTETVHKLLAAGWAVEAEGRRVRSAKRAQLSVRSKIDWFELHGDIDFDGVGVGLPELLRAIRRGSKMVRLGDGSQGMLPEEWIERFSPLAYMSAGGLAEDAVHLLPSQAMLLDVLLEGRKGELATDRGFEELRHRLRSFEGVEASEEPDGFEGELRPYQRYGLGWLEFLEQFGFGGCLADDMGLGKTVQVLALLQGYGSLEHPSLIVVPRSLVRNWIEEAARFTPELRVLAYSDLTPAERRSESLGEALKGQDLVIATYGLVRRDALALKDVRFDYVILDEAQAIKNASSQAAKACRLLSARRRLALTGTPVENHLGELWSLFEFLNPGMLGRLPALKSVGRSLEEGATARVVQALRPFILRRTKQQVLTDLPEKTEQTLYCELEGEQRRLYDELRNHYRLQLDQRVRAVGLGKSKLQVLEALLRLRQAACHPGLVDEAKRTEPSAKLELLLDQIGEVIDEGHKALVFSQFTKLLAIVRGELDERGLTYEYLDGQTRDRQARVERFQSDEACPLFLISLKAGGVGLNLTAADYVFILDPWWNPAVESQAVDRAHRIGQTRRVFAYRLVCRDTVEEKILELQRSKRKLADAILSESSSVMRQLTAEDVRILLS